MDDGVDLAATLYEPSNAPPPAGYPAIVLFHGIGGKRQDLAAIAQGFDDNFAVLAFDARGHGQSGGLVSIDGPREIADTREVYDQLAARPEIDKTRIGAWAARRHADGRNVDRRNAGDRQEAIGHGTDQEQADGE